MQGRLHPVGLVVPRSELEYVSKIILDSESMEVVDLNDVVDVKLNSEKLNPYDEDLSLLEDLYEAVGKVPRTDPRSISFPVPVDIESIREFTKGLKKEMERIDLEIEKIEDRIEKLNPEIEALEILRDVEVNVEDLRDSHFLRFRLGWIHEDYFERLESSVGEDVLILRKDRSDRVHVLLIHPRDVDIDQILKSVSFNELPLSEIDGNVEDVLFQLKDERKVLEMEKERLEIEKRKIFYSNRRFIYEYHDVLFVLKSIHDFVKFAGQSEEFAFVTGWVTDEGLEKLKKLDFILLFENVEIMSEKPTLLKNPKFLKPFEFIVRMYGIPRSDEIDPTPFVASLFLFFYGFMFGDVGHGGVISILSHLLYRRFGSDLWYVMRLAGLSSVFFGFLYGSIFGFDILPAIVGRPMERIEDFLIASIYIGVVIIVLGMVLNVLNRLKRKEIKELIFDPNGFAGLGFYLIAVSTALGYATSGKPPVPISASLSALSIFLILMFLEKIVLGEGNLGERITLAFFETFDRLIAFFSNTLSFIRLGAFAMNHAGLFLAFYTMAKMSSNPASSFLSLLFGNLLLIFLEGLVVFIQSLRLEFYEFFSKFYSGDGREFKPAGYRR